MSDLKDALERLREDVSGAGLAPAATVRRNADHRRRATWAVPVATALVAAAVLVPSALHFGSDGGSKLPVSVVPATSVPSPARWSPSPDQPWLPRPWRVDSAERTTL